MSLHGAQLLHPSSGVFDLYLQWQDTSKVLSKCCIMCVLTTHSILSNFWLIRFHSVQHMLTSFFVSCHYPQCTVHVIRTHACATHRCCLQES